MTRKILKNTELEEKLGSRKSSPPSLTGRGILRKEDIEAGREAVGIVEEAQKEADRIVAEAQKIRDRIGEELAAARARGFEDGKEEGLAQFVREIENVRRLKKEFFDHAEPEVLKMVLSIAKKVIGELVERETAAIEAVVRQALEHSLGDRIVVRLHPDDWGRINKDGSGFGDILDRTKHLHFKEDDSIERGGCIVETEIGTIDAQLETQLKAIRKALGV